MTGRVRLRAERAGDQQIRLHWAPAACETSEQKREASRVSLSLAVRDELCPVQTRTPAPARPVPAQVLALPLTVT